MDSFQDYARQWKEHENEDISSLSDWVNAVRSYVQINFTFHYIDDNMLLITSYVLQSPSWLYGISVSQIIMNMFRLS